MSDYEFCPVCCYCLRNIKAHYKSKIHLKRDLELNELLNKISKNEATIEDKKVYKKYQ